MISEVISASLSTNKPREDVSRVVVDQTMSRNCAIQIAWAPSIRWLLWAHLLGLQLLGAAAQIHNFPHQHQAPLPARQLHLSSDHPSRMLASQDYPQVQPELANEPNEVPELDLNKELRLPQISPLKQTGQLCPQQGECDLFIFILRSRFPMEIEW